MFTRVKCPCCGSEDAHKTNTPFTEIIEEPKEKDGPNENWDPWLRGRQFLSIGVTHCCCKECGEIWFEVMRLGGDFQMAYATWQYWRITGQVPEKVAESDEKHGFSERYKKDLETWGLEDQKVYLAKKKQVEEGNDPDLKAWVKKVEERNRELAQRAEEECRSE